MKCILIAVVSQDGYIARYPGDLPFKWTSKEEQSNFKKDMQKCTWSVMGRTTHELFFDINKKRIIFTKSIKKYKKVNKNHIYFNPLKTSFHIIPKLIKPVSTICILGGTSIYDYFLKNKLIHELIITVEPIKFGKGLELFTKVKWIDFPINFINKGFKEKNFAINRKGTKYYHLIKY